MKRLSFLQSLAMLGLFLGLQNMLSSLLLLPTLLVHHRLELNLTALALGNGAAFVGTVALGSLIFRVPWRELIAFGGVAWRVVPAVGIMALGSFVLCSEVDNLTRMILPVPQAFSEMFQQLMDVTRNPIGAAVALAVVAPLSEELLCRKWILGSLLGRWKPWRAIGLSAVIFGAMHLNPWQFINATLLGLAFGWIYWRTGAIWLCVLAHALNNSLFWWFGIFPPDLPGMTGPASSAPELQPLWLDGVALVAFVAGAWWLQRQTVPPEWKDPSVESSSAPEPLPPVRPPPLPPGT